MGAVTVTELRQMGPWDALIGNRAIFGKVTMSASYATGGDTLPLLTTLGLRRVNGMLIAPFAGGSVQAGFRDPLIGPATSVAIPGRASRFSLAGTPTAPLIKVEDGGAAPAEVANATALNTITFYAIIYGEQN